jgi:hypothetical protein
MIPPHNWSLLHPTKRGLSPCREHRNGVLDRARQPNGLIGHPPPLRRQSRSAEARASVEFCPFLEPRDHWTMIQVDFEWTSEGTEEFLGHGAAGTRRAKSPDRCLVQTRTPSLKPVDGNEDRADRGTTRSNATSSKKGDVTARLYLLTTGGLISVMRRARRGFLLQLDHIPIRIRHVRERLSRVMLSTVD